MARKTIKDHPSSLLRLSVPWMSEAPNVGPPESMGTENTKEFIRARTELHREYLRELQRTRRLGLCLAAGLLALACLIPVFAPTGREAISSWIAIALFVFAAGSMGYTSIKFASDKRRLDVTKDSPNA